MSQAPGLSSTPDSGHSSRAATSAALARSSSTPTSRTIRATPAVIFADSILHIGSSGRRVGTLDTAGELLPLLLLLGLGLRAETLLLLTELRRFFFKQKTAYEIWR